MQWNISQTFFFIHLNASVKKKRLENGGHFAQGGWVKITEYNTYVLLGEL